ncbi:MAG: NFACT family protein [Chlorobium phaeobacteroides]|nr:NFACT family protein [Chlorobium phaeobacteroides]
MLRNYFTLYHLARELHELVAGGYIFEIYSQQKSEITISLITNEGNHLQLIVVTGHPRLCIYTREGLQRKQRNTAGLMPELNEKKISCITIDPCDRIIRIETEDNYAIVLQLFSAKTNIFLEHNGALPILYLGRKNV